MLQEDSCKECGLKAICWGWSGMAGYWGEVRDG